ncbi:MAG: hypothetical protein H6718_15120 [Polyangiaceae bacterium]|nr:hypothetical protein [Polyangiaceae bacterium]MCB9606237.1 hypothetical protein [Polyangiaceae bacterium]
MSTRAPFWAAALSLLYLCAACGSTRTAPKHAEGLERGAPPDGKPLLAADAARATAEGAEQSRVIAVEAATPGDRVSGTLIVPKDRCVLLLARVSDSIDDVDLFAYSDGGEVLGSDERPDKEPSLVICPPHPKRIFVVARVASGHGLVAVGGQLVAPDKAAVAAKAVGHHTPPSEANVWSYFEAELQAHREELGSPWQDLRRAALPVEISAPTLSSLSLEAGQCADVFVAPSSDVSHLDLALLDAEGRTLGRGSSQGRNRTLQVCAGKPAELTLEVRPHLGRGLVALLVSQGLASEIPASKQTIRYLTETNESLPDAIKTAAELSRRLGLPLGSKLFEGSAPVGRSVSVDVDLASGCTRLDLVLGKPARGVSARLWSAGGELVAETSGDPSARLFACGEAGKFRLDVEAAVRPGAFALFSTADRKASAELRGAPLAAGRLLGLLTSRGVTRGKQLGGVKRVELSETALHREQLDVPPGRCLDIGVGAGPNVGSLELSVRGHGAGESVVPGLLTLDRGPRAVAARQCNLEGHGPLRLDIELSSRGGTGAALFGWQVLSPAP